MTLTRAQLEAEVASLKDRLGVAMMASVCARNLLVAWTTEDIRKGAEYKRLLAFVTAVAKESPMATPLFARLGWQQGMKEAKILVEGVAKEGTDEWKAACKKTVEEIDRLLQKN